MYVLEVISLQKKKKRTLELISSKLSAVVSVVYTSILVGTCCREYTTGGVPHRASSPQGEYTIGKSGSLTPTFG